MTRQSYLDYISTDGRYTAEAIGKHPDHGPYSVGHSFPALAQFDATGDKRYAATLKQCLRFFPILAQGIRPENKSPGLRCTAVLVFISPSPSETQ